jgi:HSP20 family protein
MMDNRKRRDDDESNRNMTETLDELIEHILEMFEDSVSDGLDDTIIQGFTIIKQPGKKPAIFGFAKENPDISFEENKEDDLYVIQNEPFIEVQQTGDRVYVMADLAVEETCIEFHPSNTHVDINVVTDNTCYSKYIEFPAEVDPNTIKSAYNNGVLELSFEYPEN